MTSTQAFERRQAVKDELAELYHSDIELVADVEAQHDAGWRVYAEQLRICQKKAGARDRATVNELVTAIFRNVLRREAQELEVIWRCSRKNNCATAWYAFACCHPVATVPEVCQGPGPTLAVHTALPLFSPTSATVSSTRLHPFQHYLPL